MSTTTAESIVIAAPTAAGLAEALRAGTATITADETELSVLDCDCLQDGAAWPDTNLTIRMGEWTHKIPVWAVAAWCDAGMSIDGGAKWRSGDWEHAESDGQFGGAASADVVEHEPRGSYIPGQGHATIAEPDDDEETVYTVRISGGDNLGGAGFDLDAADETEAEAAVEEIRMHLQAAYETISVPEPTDEALIEHIVATAHMTDTTHVVVDEDGELDTIHSPDSIHVTMRHAHLLGRHLYSVHASTDEGYRAEEQVYVGAKRAAEAARDLLADVLADATSKLRSASVAKILPSEDEE